MGNNNLGRGKNRQKAERRRYAQHAGGTMGKAEGLKRSEHGGELCMRSEDKGSEMPQGMQGYQEDPGFCFE